MNLTCPACGSAFSADDVHVELGVANCRVCRGVLDLRAADRPIDRPRPERFTLDESDGRMVITWRWFKAVHLVMVPFAIFWWGFLFVWYAKVIPNAHGNMFPVVFPLLHVGAGVWVVYTLLANLLNRTRIVADDGGLTVTHGPVPWRGKRLERATLAQLFCETVHGSKGSISFALVGVDREGRRVRLVGGFSAEDEPRWLEAALERRLHIKNQRVVGETR